MRDYYGASLDRTLVLLQNTELDTNCWCWFLRGKSHQASLEQCCPLVASGPCSSKYGELLHYWMDLSAELSYCVNYDFEYVQEIDFCPTFISIGW